MGRFFQHPYNTLFTKERALQDFDFPIAFCNGTRDFFGNAEGADTIVKNNRYFKSGRSQLFKLKNAGHNVFMDDPKGLADYMIGFFEGTITHTFDLKPRKDFVPDDDVPDVKSGASMGKKLFALGSVCALAAGAYLYLKK